MHSTDPMTFTGLSAATGLAKSTTSRLLLALERNGLVRRDDHGRFLPGEMFVSFAWRGGAEAGLSGWPSPSSSGSARRPARRSTSAWSAAAWWSRSPRSTAPTSSADQLGGLSVPLHCSALGKVLLAYGTAQLSGQLPAGRLERRTDKTITSEAALRAELAGVRARGYAITDEELEPGLIAVAAPVHGFDGAVVAALSVLAPASRMTRDRVSATAAYCVAEAVGLSAGCSGRPARRAPHERSRR